MKVIVCSLGKSCAVLGLVGFFLFGGFAVSMAHDAATLAPVQTLQLHRVSTLAPAQSDRYTLSVAMDFEATASPKWQEPTLQQCGSSDPQSINSFGISCPAPAAAKVSLPVINSVLLL